MAKKSRRAKAKYRARAAKAVEERHPQQPRPMPTKLQSPARVSARASPKAQDFTTHYQYVLPEIKRIGLIAGCIILVLIILSFVLR